MADREEELRELWSIFDGDIKDSTALDPQTLEDIFIQYGGRGTPFRKRSDVVHFFVFLKSPKSSSLPKHLRCNEDKILEYVRTELSLRVGRAKRTASDIFIAILFLKVAYILILKIKLKII